MKTQRRSNQEGNLYQSHGAWYVRYRENGKNNPVAHRLANTDEYPKKSEVIPLKKKFMDRVNRTAHLADAGIAILDFFEEVYLPAITARLKPSTVKGYKDSWRCHIKPRISGRVRDFMTVDGENLMAEIEAANKTENDDLAHGTYKHIKVTLSAMFTFAKRKGIYDGANPMTGVTIPKGKKHGRKRPAYTLEEVEKHLELFSGHAPIVISAEDGLYTPEISQRVVRAVIGVAGSRWSSGGEIRGQTMVGG